MHTITSLELKRRIDRGDKLTILDVRREEDYYDGHIPGAILGTSDYLEEAAWHLIPDQTATIVTYSAYRDCRRSILSVERLKRLGYSVVIHYEEGYVDWVKNGFPTA